MARRGACTAVGYHAGTGGARPLAEAWNGTRWHIQTVPLPHGSPGGILAAVSCTSPRACTATGANFSATGPTLAERWNGTRWRVQPAPYPGQLWYGPARARTERRIVRRRQGLHRHRRVRPRRPVGLFPRGLERPSLAAGHRAPPGRLPSGCPQRPVMRRGPVHRGRRLVGWADLHRDPGHGRLIFAIRNHWPGPDQIRAGRRAAWPASGCPAAPRTPPGSGMPPGPADRRHGDPDRPARGERAHIRWQINIRNGTTLCHPY
jgi:hypothetical protein